jgi:hypothetical protein
MILIKSLYLQQVSCQLRDPLISTGHGQDIRSCFIKQADVHRFVLSNISLIQTIKRNFNYYEPMTVHEFIISMHSFDVVSRIGNIDKAYELYLNPVLIWTIIIMGLTDCIQARQEASWQLLKDLEE